MNLIDAPLLRTDPVGSAAAGRTAAAMRVGQHVMAVLLTVVGVVRAVSDGASTSAAVVAGLAILAAHTVGTTLPTGQRSGRVVVGWLVGFAVVWVAAVAVSVEFVWVAFLLWLLAGHLLPLGWGIAFAAAVFGVTVTAPILERGTTSYANVIGPLIGGVFAFGISRGYLQLLRDAAERERLVRSLVHARDEMAGLQDELALAQRQAGAVEERTRISRDIHDTIAQALSSIRLLAHAGAGRSDDAQAARTLGQIEALAGDSLADVRRIVAALAPAELDEHVLAGALRRMLDRAQDEAGLRGELHVDDAFPSLPTNVEVALLRTAQSALANVRLHAQASRVVVSLVEANGLARLDIRDDGVGFDVSTWERTAEPSGAASSYGLRFMRSRLRELGGGLDVDSTPGDGTSVTVYLPVHREATPPVHLRPLEGA